MRLIAKILEAVGIAAVMIGFILGLHSDMWGELYFFLSGVAVFVFGRMIEKRQEKKPA